MIGVIGREFNLTTTRKDFEVFVRQELPWANHSVRQLMLDVYANGTGLPEPVLDQRLLCIVR